MYYGLDKFRELLVTAGWKISKVDNTHSLNSCNWYAWRRSKAVTDCICNAKPPSLCVYPYWCVEPMRYSSFEVVITGETATGWVQLKHYSHELSEIDTIDSIEASLVLAWEAMSKKS